MAVDLGQKLHSVQGCVHTDIQLGLEHHILQSPSFPESYLYFQAAMNSEQSSPALTYSSFQRTKPSKAVR